jgi:putative AdoMet-dependent methyltransferase
VSGNVGQKDDNLDKNYTLSWQYDEFKQVGTDYGSEAEVAIYDSRHGDFRDLDAESISILDFLEIKERDTVIDFGSGTGTFAIQAARRCARVYAVDVSKTMLDRAESKATKSGVTNIEFHHAGFLTYEHADQPVDAIVSTFAFHHLPDFWKGIALKRINNMLKPGGQFYIHDVIMEEGNAIDNIQVLIDKLAVAGGKRLQDDTERHFKDEYSTYDWVMEELLIRAGFRVKSKHMDGGVLGTYICTK